MIKPVVDGPVTQLDAGCTELLVKLSATSKEPNHTLHVDAWCFHVENMRILREEHAQQKTYSFFNT